ncbi:AbrB/MazE/SpoVT family DNA-binding domain-containing protein [Acidovorax delafieldii]|uniref:AbrB/MazE/SpoVT family DNA-binding domain-containing protein n=1 Tax=Acidovorax delafieldii TaxID=47920 RepID=UPI003ECC2CFD
MYTTHLRNVGGSVMLIIPPEFLKVLHLEVGASVSIAIENGRLIIQPKAPPRYTLDELIAQTDPAALAAAKADMFTMSGPVGRELL